MCFSATASFAAGAVLGTVGLITITKAKTTPQRAFAAIPLIFAVQQCTEGLLWVSLDNTSFASLKPLLTYIFLVFAMAVWPFWIPYTIHGMETDKRRKKILRFFVWVGAIVAIGVLIILFSYPVEVITPYCPTCPSPNSPAPLHHLHYEFAIPRFVKNLIAVFSVLYILATIISPFLSSIKKMKWLGIVFLASYLFAVILYQGFVISVWCFFAAILSFIVWWIIADQTKSNMGRYNNFYNNLP